MAVIAVRCSSVTEMDAPIEQAIFDENGEIVDYETVVERSYYANFSLKQSSAVFQPMTFYLRQRRLPFGFLFVHR